MLMTEEEAREKWCSQTIIRRQEFTEARGWENNAETCEASGCMAWRWAPQRAQTTEGDEVPYLGYCGLAGKPESA